MAKATKYGWTGWAAVLFFFALASQATADTDWCYKHLQKGEYDQSLEACTKELQSGKYDGDQDVIASRLNYRGTAYFNKLGKRNYDRAIADLTKAIALLPDDASSYYMRGVTYLWSGRYDRAIDDFTKLLSLHHMVSTRLPYYTNRGITYWLKGDYDRALADFTAGITQGEGLGQSSFWSVRNDVVALYELRGNLCYSTGDYESAVSDYRKVIELGAYRSYLHLRIWLALNELSADQAEDFREELRSSVKQDLWPGIIVKYYLGLDGATEKDVLDQARQKDDDVVSVNAKLGEAYFYLGEARLRQGDSKGAAAFFQKSAAIESRYRSSEKLLAKVRLAQMKKLKGTPDRRHGAEKIRWMPR